MSRVTDEQIIDLYRRSTTGNDPLDAYQAAAEFVRLIEAERERADKAETETLMLRSVLREYTHKTPHLPNTENL